jgi:cysteinyl-tRNA synthetase
VHGAGAGGRVRTWTSWQCAGQTQWMRVTEHIPEILAYIERLLELGSAYVGEDGVYFDCSLAHQYKFGSLVRRGRREKREAGNQPPPPS